MDNILEFKPKIVKQDSSLIDNDDLIDTTVFDNTSRDIGYINGKQVVKPKTCYEYLMLSKMFLTDEDYMDLCTGIMDHDWYNSSMDPKLKQIVDCYYTYKV
jgi:hypothetical protein